MKKWFRFVETSINKLFWINDSELLTASDDKQIMHWQVEIEG